MALHQTTIDHAHQHNPNDIDREQPAVVLRRNAVIANIDIRRTGDKSVSRDVKESQTEGITHKRPVFYQRGVIAKRAKRRSFLPTLWRQSFRQPAQGDKHQSANHHQQPENSVPAGEFNHLPADQRPGNRRNRHHDSQRREHLRGAGTSKQIANQRPRQHRPSAGAKRLKHAPENNLIDGGRQRAAGGADNK